MLRSEVAADDQGRRGLILVALGVMALPLLSVALAVAAVETTWGPVHIGTYSIAGPRTWIRFAGKADFICEIAGYKLFRRHDPVVTGG